MKKLKPGVYIRQWDIKTIEIGVLVPYKKNKFLPFGAIIETYNFAYMLNLDKWIYIGEL